MIISFKNYNVINRTWELTAPLHADSFVTAFFYE